MMLFITAIYNLLTVMKPETPATNTLIATLYLLCLLAIAYLAKRLFHPARPSPAHYTPHNYTQHLHSARMRTHLNPVAIVMRSYAYKYSLAGAVANGDRVYLLKEIFICAMVSTACLNINWITLWPVVLAQVATWLCIVVMEYCRYPALLRLDTRVSIEKNPGCVDVANQAVQLEPGFGSGQQYEGRAQQQVKQDDNDGYYSYKYVICLGSVLFATLVMVSHTMFTVYNSLSNLGPLNLGSLASIIAIDQLAIRPVMGLLLFAAVRVCLHMNNKSAESAEQLKAGYWLGLFDYRIFRNLCQPILVQEMNAIYEEYGESQYQMGASPTKKKAQSPSKVPKAAPLLSDTETLMQLHQPKLPQQPGLQQAIDEQPELACEGEDMDERSPIKKIQLMEESNLFTSAEKKMFAPEDENDQNEMNRSATLDQLQRGKNTNQFFSAQRLPKSELPEQDQLLEADGLVLVEAGLNLVRQPNFKQKPCTIEVDFSPDKRRRRAPAHTKKRQLIITGSSPYLEYLPDMMKKEKGKKTLMTPSHSQIPTISRKVL